MTDLLVEQHTAYQESIDELQEEVDDTPSFTEVETHVGRIYYAADNLQHGQILEALCKYLAEGGNPTKLEQAIDRANKEPYIV